MSAESTREAGALVNPLPQITQPCVLVLRHVASDGSTQSKMIGKVIAHPFHGLICFHAHSGSQPHHKTRCPAPLDVRLVCACGQNEIAWIYVYDRAREVLWKIRTADVAQAPIAVYDNRARFYPPAEMWERREGITETRSGRRLLYTSGREVVIATEHIPDDQTIDLTELVF